MFGVMSSVMFVSLSMLLSPETGPASARLSQCPHTPAPAPTTGYWGDTDSATLLTPLLGSGSGEKSFPDVTSGWRR